MISPHFIAALCLAPLLALPAQAQQRYTVTALPAGTTAAGINHLGQVVGDIDGGGGREGFVWSNGSLVRIGAMGGSFASATAINGSGVVVGYAQTADGNVQAFQYRAGVTTTLSVPGASSAYATGINDLGQIAGQYFSATSGTRAFLASGAGVADLGDLGGGFAAAHGLNNAGQAVGFSALDEAPFHAHGFVYVNGVMQDLGAFPDASLSEATAINEAGQIAGQGWVQGSFHAFLYRDGALNDLGTLGGRESFAADINNLGQIVGYSDLAGDFEQAAYLWQAGVMIDLNALIDPALGWTIARASAINDRGQIAAYGCRAALCGALLLDLAAVPEPATPALLLAALALLWARRRGPAARPFF